MRRNEAAQSTAMALRPDARSSISEINLFNSFRTVSVSLLLEIFHDCADMLKISNAFGARKRCVLADYKRPNTIHEDDGFSDCYESLQDITIHIPELVELSDTLLRCSSNKESEVTFLRICDRWQNLSFQLNCVSMGRFLFPLGLHLRPNSSPILLSPEGFFAAESSQVFLC
jgi:hypothetical protein